MTYCLILLLIFSQTVALWLRNTNYREEQKTCFGFIKDVTDKEEVLELFQRKSVFEMLWGYTDKFLEDLVASTELVPQCPGPEGGLKDFVQMQVRRCNEQIGVSFSCVCPVVDHEFCHNSVKVAVDPR